MFLTSRGKGASSICELASSGIKGQRTTPQVPGAPAKLVFFSFLPSTRHQTNPPGRGEENRHFGSLRPASLRRHMRSAAPFSPQFCTCAPTAERRCPLGSVHAGEQPHRSRSAAVSRSERSAQATRPPLAALASDLIASSISRPSASKLSMMDIVDREADAERPRGG